MKDIVKSVDYLVAISIRKITYSQMNNLKPITPPVSFWMTTNQIKNVLVFYHQHFKQFRHIHDVALLDECATKLAKAIKKNPNHKLRGKVYALGDLLPGYKLY